MLLKKALKQKLFCPLGHILDPKMKVAYAIPNNIIHNPICVRKIFCENEFVSESKKSETLDFDIDLFKRLDVSDPQEEKCLPNDGAKLEIFDSFFIAKSVSIEDLSKYKKTVSSVDVKCTSDFPQINEEKMDECKKSEWHQLKFHQRSNKKCQGKRKGKDRRKTKIKIPRLLTIQEASKPGPSSAGVNLNDVPTEKLNFREIESSSTSSLDALSDYSEYTLSPATRKKNINFAFMNDQNHVHDCITRPKRCVKRRLEKSCPICELSLIPHKLNEHFEKEKHDLSKLIDNMKKKKRLRKSNSQEVNQKELFKDVKARRSQRVIAQRDNLKSQKNFNLSFV